MEPLKFVAAAAQMTATGDRDANLEVCRRLASDAAARGTRLLVLPECFGFLGRRERDKFEHAEKLDPESPGPILGMLLECAQQHGMWIVGGGMAERVEQECDAREVTTAYNTAVVVSPTGELAARYRKIHLFDVDIPGKATLRESDATAGGREVVSCETDVGVLGVTICYDVRFPELYRELTLRHGAHILLVPAAFTAHTGKAHWHALLRARAIENQCFVIAAAQDGRHNEKRASFGHSAIYDPWGDLLAELPEGTGLATAEIDMNRLQTVRRNMPCASHVKLS